MNKRTAQSVFQQHRESIRQGVRRQHAVDFFNVLTGPLLLELTEAHLPAHRERLYPPTVVLSMFIKQALEDDGSCQRAVNGWAAQRAAEGLSPHSVRTGAYCRARQRLPAEMVRALTRETGKLLCAQANSDWRWRGRMVKLVDGTGISMPDTPDNPERYPQPSSQAPGVGFPLARLVGVICLSTGAVVDAAVGPFEGKGHTLKHLYETPPEMFNRDGEALVFTETRFPFLAEQLHEITRRLDAAADWERDNPDEHTWIWLPETDTVADKKQGGNAFDTLRSGQHPINGTLEAKPGVLTLTTNSVERSQRGQGVLEALLHGLVGPALSALQTPEQLMAENENRQRGDGDPESTDTIDPEIAAEIIRHTLDQHYRQSLDEAIPALDNKTPRQCVRSKKGREKVIEWLKHLENSELRRAASQGQEPYDSSWMWVELKLDKHRNSQP